MSIWVQKGTKTYKKLNVRLDFKRCMTEYQQIVHEWKVKRMRNFEKPYPNLNIADYSHMFEVNGRFKCDSCKKNRKFFCYSCSIPHPEITVPNIKV